MTKSKLQKPDTDTTLTLLIIIALFFIGTFASLAGADPIGRFRLPTRGLYVQIERRGWPSEYWSGQVIQDFNLFDTVVGHTRAEEAALQLDKMVAMGVNTISFELRTADGGTGPFVPPTCPIPFVLGFQWPQPTNTELTNLKAFFDLLQSKGMRVMLRLVNTHMEEQPPTNSQTWLGAILGVVKDHPALDLVLFEGNTHLVDTNGDGVPDTCGIPAEPPLWLGSTSVPAQYVKWAINYAMSLGLPARQLSAEAVVGDFFLESNPPAGCEATDCHLWSPILVLKTIFDDLAIPDNQRTYAASFYEHRKCATAHGLPCTDTDPHTWAEQTLQKIFTIVGTGNGARVVVPEMGVLTPVGSSWPAEHALESLVFLMEKWGVEGGSYWIWVHVDNSEDANPDINDAVKRRGTNFIYNPVQEQVLDMGGFHLTEIPNGSFESDSNLDGFPDHWTVAGSGTGARYFLAGEAGQPEVPSRGKYALRLLTGSGLNDEVNATSEMIEVSPSTVYTTTAYMRFGWSGDPNPGGNPTTRPQVFVGVHYFNGLGSPSAVRQQDVFRFFQEDSTQGFDTFPLQYTTPSDAGFVQIEVGAARNGLPTAITLDADNLDPARFTLLALGALALPSAEVGVSYSAPLVTGGVPPYTFTLLKGVFPPGLGADSANGLLSGTPTPSKGGTFTVQITDQLGSSVTGKFKIKILGALEITSTVLKAGTNGKAYKGALKAKGGKKPYSWSLLSGSLPTGLTLNSLTGAITGIPTQAGTFNLTFQVTDPLGGQAQKNLTLTIR